MKKKAMCIIVIAGFNAVLLISGCASCPPLKQESMQSKLRTQELRERRMTASPEEMEIIDSELDCIRGCFCKPKPDY